MSEKPRLLTLNELHALIAETLSASAADDLDLSLVDDDARPTVQLGLGWFLYIRRLTTACLRLVEVGYAHETAALRRTLIEHLVALAWLARDGQTAVDVFNYAWQESSVRRLAGEVSETGWSERTEAAAREVLEREVSADVPDGLHLIHFSHLVKEMGWTSGLAAWLTETAIAHPSILSSAAFVDIRDDQLVVRQEGDTFTAHEVVRLLAGALYDAARAMAALLPDRPWTAALDRIAGRYNLATEAEG